jgi:hypothetical protein
MLSRTSRALLAGAATIAVIGGTAAPAPAATPTGTKAGFVATPAQLHGARVTLRVPKIDCSASKRPGLLRLGLFGTTRDSVSTHHWYVAVLVSCRHGQARYRAGFGDAADPAGAEGMAVAAHDLIRLKVKPGPQYEIDNVTTGEAEGGATAGPGGTETSRRVVIGGHVQGTVPVGTRALLRAAKVNGTAVAKVDHQRQNQRRGGVTLLVAGPLDRSGTVFTLTTK